MIAYKFLQAGRVAPFSGVTWPEDGVYVDATEGPLAACRNGVHGCRVRDLPYWLDDELWEIELDGEVVEDELKLVARRAAGPCGRGVGRGGAPVVRRAVPAAGREARSRRAA